MKLNIENVIFVCACVRVYVPFRAGENPYSLSSDRINQINLLEGAAK